MKRPVSGFRVVNGQSRWVHPFQPEEEQSLIERLQANDMAARGELLVAYAPYIHRIAHKYPHVGIEPDDMIQTINEKFLEAKDDLYNKYVPQPGKHIGYWVITIATNMVRDELRRYNREQELFTSGDRHLGDENDSATVFDMQKSTDRGPLDTLASERFTEMAKQRIEALPEMQRRVIEALISGQNVEETAALLDISEGSVKTHTSRARYALRDLRSELA